MATIATTITEAERLIAEMHESVHASGPLHCEINRAVHEAMGGMICNDVFLESSPTLDGLLSLWEIKHVRHGA